MDKYFKLTENGTNVKREIVAGITTFLTMAYIIAVNPNFLSTAMGDGTAGALVTATCLAAGLTTILMGLYANAPFALASGMGLNAFFAFTVCGAMGVSWQVALTAVFVEGIIFIILSLTRVREAVVNCIPLTMKHAVTAGIGLFIAFIGLTGAGIVVSNEATLVSLGSMVAPSAIIAVIGILIIAILNSKNVKGAMLWSILICSIIGWIYAIVNPEGATTAGIYLPNRIFKYESIKAIAFKLDFSVFTNSSAILNFITVCLTFLFVDFFDTVGTLVGVCSKANMLDKDGNVPMAKKALLVDAIGTTFGSLVGVSTVTTYVESAAGVSEGGRTGLTAVTTGVLFLLAMFLSPIFIAIPGCATAPCLIWIGFMMLESVMKIDFTDFTQGFPAFITIAAMPLCYSIGDGLTLGILSYTLINLLNNIFGKKENKKPISIVMYILSIIFILKLIFM
ncbi:NCS2 family permease [Clostridium sp.]|uniref:NCS2 family permease n=1 Tax=Clostridium sp. TaxID=1506 RepID=UPI0032171E9C